jgi:hypothetical protein
VTEKHIIRFAGQLVAGVPVIRAITEEKTVDLSSWAESQGWPPETPLGWGAVPPVVLTTTALLMLNYIGWQIEPLEDEAEIIAQDVLRRLNCDSWQFDETQIAGYLCCHDLVGALQLLNPTGHAYHASAN